MAAVKSQPALPHLKRLWAERPSSSAASGSSAPANTDSASPLALPVNMKGERS